MIWIKNYDKTYISLFDDFFMYFDIDDCTYDQTLKSRCKRNIGCAETFILRWCKPVKDYSDNDLMMK